MEEENSREDREELESATQLITGAKFRGTHGITKPHIVALKETVAASNETTKSLRNDLAILSKESVVLQQKITEVKNEVIDSATRFGKQQSEAEKKYKTLITTSEYLQDAAANDMNRAVKDIDNYKGDDFALKSNIEQIENENASIRLSVSKFKELKTTVTEFRDNLRGFVSSVVPIERTPDKNANTPITKKVLGAAEGGGAVPSKSVPRGAAGMMRAREKRESVAMDNTKRDSTKAGSNEEPRRFKI